MAITYDNVAFGRIEEALKQYVDDEFQNVYISPKFVDRGINSTCMYSPRFHYLWTFTNDSFTSDSFVMAVDSTLFSGHHYFCLFVFNKNIAN